MLDAKKKDSGDTKLEYLTRQLVRLLVANMTSYRDTLLNERIKTTHLKEGGLLFLTSLEMTLIFTSVVT